jgi:N4-gp56 family major capsid protein
MPDAQTLSTAFSAAIRHTTQKKVLANLRHDLVFADEAYAEQGEFDSGSDTILFTNVPDLGYSTTPLTEGVRPAKRALSMGTVTIDTDQYGDLVSITDVAKVKSPLEVVNIGTERLSRQSKQVIDEITRDAIAGGGTAFLADAVANRAALGSGNKADVADLKKLAWTMFKNSIPRFEDGFYRLFVSPEVAYDLGNDTAFIDAFKYVDNTPLIKNEIGKIAGFRVMEVVNAPTFSSSVTVHASLAVGAVKGWGAGELQTLDTYHVAPGGDHSDPLAQEELLGWKIMFGVAVLSNSYYMRYESAASSLS